MWAWHLLLSLFSSCESSCGISGDLLNTIDKHVSSHCVDHYLTQKKRNRANFLSHLNTHRAFRPTAYWKTNFSLLDIVSLTWQQPNKEINQNNVIHVWAFLLLWAGNSLDKIQTKKYKTKCFLNIKLSFQDNFYPIYSSVVESLEIFTAQDKKPHTSRFRCLRSR